jgi:hypothetical protein
MEVPDSAKGFVYEARYWLELTNKVIWRSGLAIVVGGGLTFLAAVFHWKFLWTGYPLVPLLAFMPSAILTIIAAYLILKLANLLTAAVLLLIPWVRKQAEKVVGIFAAIYLATFLASSLIAAHFWELSSPTRFVLLMLVIPILTLIVLGLTIHSGRVSGTMGLCFLLLIAIFYFAVHKGMHREIEAAKSEFHKKIVGLETKTEAPPPEAPRPRNNPLANLPPSTSPQTSPVNTESYHPDQYLGPDGTPTVFEHSAFPNNSYEDTFPVGYWVWENSPTKWDANFFTQATSCPSYYYLKPIPRNDKHINVTQIKPIGPFDWCDKDPAHYTTMDYPSFLVQAVQPDETVVFSSMDRTIPPPAFVSVATRSAQIVSIFPEALTIHGFPNLPCTDDVRHMNSSGNAKPARVDFGITVNGATAGVVIVQGTGVSALDDKVKDFARSYKFDPATTNGPPLPVPLAEVEVDIPANCHD